MNASKMGFALRKQCADCPWRLDVPGGGFPAERYRSLFVDCIQNEAAMMACHKTHQRDPQACVGYLAAEGDRLVLPRLARYSKRWSPELLSLAPVEQHPNFESMARANGAEVDRKKSHGDGVTLATVLAGGGDRGSEVGEMLRQRIAGASSTSKSGVKDEESASRCRPPVTTKRRGDG